MGLTICLHLPSRITGKILQLHTSIEYETDLRVILAYSTRRKLRKLRTANYCISVLGAKRRWPRAEWSSLRWFILKLIVVRSRRVLVVLQGSWIQPCYFVVGHRKVLGYLISHNGHDPDGGYSSKGGSSSQWLDPPCKSHTLIERPPISVLGSSTGDLGLKFGRPCVVHH